MAKKILIILGHPDKDSYNASLAKAYKTGAEKSGALVREIFVSDLGFSLSLDKGYKNLPQLEPDLVNAQENIRWADHLVIVHPLWWGSIPAVLKGFFDRVFLPGFAFKYRENSVWWDKLLKGKSGHIIMTLDQPVWYYWLINGRPSINSLKKMTLEFCGIKPVKITAIGPIRKSSPNFKLKKLVKVNRYGERMI